MTKGAGSVKGLMRCLALKKMSRLVCQQLLLSYRKHAQVAQAFRTMQHVHEPPAGSVLDHVQGGVGRASEGA